MSSFFDDHLLSAETHGYKLPIEDLRDGTKLKTHIVSMQTVANIAQVVIQSSSIPGLSIAGYAMKASLESFDSVQRCREKCNHILRQAFNSLGILHDNQMRIISEKVARMIRTFRKAAENMQHEIYQFAKYGFWRSWYNRHSFSAELVKFQMAIDEFCRDLPLAVTDDLVSELLEELRIARSQSERDALQERIYNIRMKPNIDVSDLPADLSLEIRYINERPIAGSECWVKQGKWLNRDVVALKFPRDFAVLRCSDSQFCGGTEDTCSEPHRHVPAAKAMERFRRQVDIWRSLNHPNVLKFYGWCKIRDQVHLVTQWLEAGNVKHYCKVSKLSDAEILNIVRDIALGLQYVHSKDVVHAALTPKNVLIKPDGAAAIGDFSRAKIVPADNSSMNRTDMSEQVTLMRYQALEEQQSPRPMSKQGDIFAWSMVSLEVISGVEPYPKERSPNLLYERIFKKELLPALEEHPSPLWEKHPGLWELIHSCQNMDRLARPSLDDIITKLDECIEKERASS